MKTTKLSHESSHEVRRGPWTLEEDNLLTHFVSLHGEGRWNILAKFAGLKRTGKSCRLRWLNYLKPDIKRGNLTPQEQVLIVELHGKLGNRWSKIAQELPGRTDNEIKNYWRTRVRKQARQLNIESNSKRFLDFVRDFLMPTSLEKMEQSCSYPSPYNTIPDSSASNLIKVPLKSMPTCPKKSTTEPICSNINGSRANSSMDSYASLVDIIDQQPPVDQTLATAVGHCFNGQSSSWDMDGFDVDLIAAMKSSFDCSPRWILDVDDDDDEIEDTLWNMDDMIMPV